MKCSDGTRKRRIARLAMYALTNRWAHPNDNTMELQTGWTSLPVMQTAVADIVAQLHRMTEVEAAVGRYTPFVTCIAGSFAIAVDLGCSPVEIAASYSGFVLADTARFADTQSPQARENVLRWPNLQTQLSDFCPSSSGLGQAVPVRYLRARSACSLEQSLEGTVGAHTVVSGVRHLPCHSSGQARMLPTKDQKPEFDLPVRPVGLHRLSSFPAVVRDTAILGFVSSWDGHAL